MTKSLSSHFWPLTFIFFRFLLIIVPYLGYFLSFLAEDVFLPFSLAHFSFLYFSWDSTFLCKIHLFLQCLLKEQANLCLLILVSVWPDLIDIQQCIGFSQVSVRANWTLKCMTIFFFSEQRVIRIVG